MTLTIANFENKQNIPHFTSNIKGAVNQAEHKTNFLDKLFPPAVQEALKLDENFSLAIDPVSGSEYIIINAGHHPNLRGTRFNIYV